VPSKSDKQKRLMAAVANNPKFAKKVGIPQSVGREFEREDKKMSNCGTRRMRAGGMAGFKPCAECPNPAGCAAKGKCALKAKGKAMPKAMKAGGMTGYKKGGFPDLNKDGKITKADILKGRGVTNMRAGGKVRGCGMARQGVRPAKMR
jgi:hypothetical protein